MSDKEEISRTIFGIGRADGCVLSHLSDAQQNAVLDTLTLTDELDTLYDEQSGGASYVASYTKAREKYEEVLPGLPNKDIRAALLGTTLKGYEDLGSLIVGTELGRFNDDMSPTVLSARMRKHFLRKIIGGQLDQQGQDFLTYLLGLGKNTKVVGSVVHAKIPLPAVTRAPNAKAHPFPVQVSLQTQEFIQAVLFYGMFADYTAGEYVRLPDALNKIEQKLIEDGLDKKLWDNGWDYLQKYQMIFNNTLFQNVLILMRSHWDWYIRQMGEFVVFARNHVSSPVLDAKKQKSLERVAFKEITQQIAILEEACGINFNLPNSVLSDIAEMALVRNLGMHNRWEVDDFYLQKTTSTTPWELKDIRLLEVDELKSWAGSLSKLIVETSFQIAAKYVAAPDFP
jgi:hypothetical protein